ncbi:MAG: hypothetical protein J6J74_06870 [Elusimicrobiaceae bacterium]|nr:hypothetical protein [Elusimicrobiaceae bacterium]
MENTVFLQLIGFTVCFILLFVFTAKYRAALAHETDFEPAVEDLTVVTVAQQPAYKPRAAILQSLQGTASLETADLKEKVKDLHYRLEELKIAQDKTSGEFAKQMARMEQRISTFEQEYVAKLQPTLLSLIEELENMKVSENKTEK